MEIGKEYTYVTGTKMFLVEEVRPLADQVEVDSEQKLQKWFIFHWADEKGSINALQLKQEQIDVLIK